MSLESLGAWFIDCLPFLISLFSFIIGIAGLWFSYKSYKNTKNIVDAINLEKLKDKYRIKHNEFVSSIKTVLTELRNGNRSYSLVMSLFQTCTNIKVLNDGWQTDDKETLDAIILYLVDIPNNKEIDDATWFSLQKHISIILAILEREGGVRKNRRA